MIKAVRDKRKRDEREKGGEIDRKGRKERKGRKKRREREEKGGERGKKDSLTIILMSFESQSFTNSEWESICR